MAADVTSLIRIMTEYKKDVDHDNSDLITRDFLGGCAAAVIGSKELDLDLKVPSGWERRLDLLSGETYLEKTAPLRREVHDLNLPPPPAAASLDGSALDLKLLLTPHPRPPAAGAYESVCTLDKVRSALERAGRGSECRTRAQPQRSEASASPPSSPIKKRPDQETDGPDSPEGLMAAGCPSCLMYVLISKGNPRCPRCDSHVPAPAPATVVSKKPRIDLNLYFAK